MTEFGFILGAALLAVAAAALLARPLLRRQGLRTASALLGATHAAAARAFQASARTLAALALLIALLCFVAFSVVRPHLDADPAGSSFEFAAWMTLSFVLGAVSVAAAARAASGLTIRATSHMLDALRTGPAACVSSGMRAASAGTFLATAIVLLGLGLLCLAAFGAAGGLLTPPNAVASRSMTLLVTGYPLGAAFGALLITLLGSVFAASALAAAPAEDCSSPPVLSARVAPHLDHANSRVAASLSAVALAIVGGAIVCNSVGHANPDALHAGVGLPLLPLLVLAFGIASSGIGLLVLRTDGIEPSMVAIQRGLYVTLALVAASCIGLCRWLLGPSWLGPALASQCGLLAVLLLTLLTPRILARAQPEPHLDHQLSRLPAFTSTLEHATVVATLILLACAGGYWAGRLSTLQGGGSLGLAIATLALLAPAPYLVSASGFATILLAALQHQRDPAPHRPAAAPLADRNAKLKRHSQQALVVARDYAVAISVASILVAVVAYVSVARSYGSAVSEAWSELAGSATVLGAWLGGLVVAWLAGAVLRAVARVTRGCVSASLSDQQPQETLAPPLTTASASRQQEFLLRLLQDASRQGIPLVLLAVAAPLVIWALIRLWTGPLHATVPVETLAGVILGATIVSLLMGSTFEGAGTTCIPAAATRNLEAPPRKSAVDDAPKRANNLDHGAAVVGDTLGTPLRFAAGPCLHALVKMLAAGAVALAPLFH